MISSSEDLRYSPAKGTKPSPGKAILSPRIILSIVVAAAVEEDNGGARVNVENRQISRIESEAGS
jgi:hypothetical protein